MYLVLFLKPGVTPSLIVCFHDYVELRVNLLACLALICYPYQRCIIFDLIGSGNRLYLASLVDLFVLNS